MSLSQPAKGISGYVGEPIKIIAEKDIIKLDIRSHLVSNCVCDESEVVELYESYTLRVCPKNILWHDKLIENNLPTTKGCGHKRKLKLGCPFMRSIVMGKELYSLQHDF